ncbi:MAG: metalloregulator ArsR/SmtB family transcription factor [Gemmatimonadota bacterium]
MATQLTAATIDLVAERFRTLGEPTRLILLDQLRRGQERSVNELVDATGAGQANVSKHLQILLAAGFVSRRKDGTTVYYQLADPTVFQLCDLVCGRAEVVIEQKRRALRRR